ncbi:hypothetical protein Hamer_G016458 [Homarus americanus]|uniref:Uncharacterized protein n=1 Tax=Homarus americanus TaxID=6706 RepID=A0A8J5N7K1_HOMAM|nr:hypothetical protein Hamer_G016458 [Homarus americanus]
MLSWNCWKHNGGYPTRAVLGRLEEKAEKKDMTLREVLEVLEELGQHDVLDCVPWEEGMKLFKKGTQKIEVLTQGSADEGEPTSPRVSPSPRENPSRIILDAKILMVFASDARTEAMRVVHQLRNPLTSRGKVGVLLLTDPDNYIVARQLTIEGCNSIHKWFKQVNFVVPVLSPKFLLQIQNRDDDNTNKEEKLYNRFVYRLLLDHYVSRGSKNLKCRPLYPVEFSRQVLQSELVKDNGLLMMLWKCSSEESVEEFAKIITNEVRQRRR